MDTGTRPALRRPELVTQTVAAPLAEAADTLTVTAVCRLSEEGWKVSLLAGGDGRALQQIAVQVPTNRLHLVSVEAEGVARLKLRPRYEIDGEQRVARVDAPPTYDSAPAFDGFFRAATKNHEIERAYHTERTATRARRRQSELRTQLAQTFLSDCIQWALVHPAPSAKRVLSRDRQGGLLFDIATDEGRGREVPAEAHRRFWADLRARHERNQQEPAAQLALHEEKKRVIAQWIGAHGIPEQQARQAAGMLPMEEAIEAMTDEVFGVVGDRPVYPRDGAERLQAHLRQLPQYADAAVTAADLVLAGSNALKATAAQWALVQELQPALPDATVTLRVHRLAETRDSQAPALMVFGVLVTRKVGPFTLRREYAAPDHGFAY